MVVLERGFVMPKSSTARAARRATGCRNPSVAVADRAPRAIREGAADMNRRVWFLPRFRPGQPGRRNRWLVQRRRLLVEGRKPQAL
jgi:hypothetical protein